MLKDRTSKAVMAHLLPRAQQVVRSRRKRTPRSQFPWMSEGFKSDQEAALRALAQSVKNGSTLVPVEEVPKNDADGGDAKNAVQRMQGQARALKAHLEEKLQEALPNDSNIIS